MRIIAFTKYDREAASTRQRFLQYGPALAAAGIALDHRPLLSSAYVRSLATHEGFSRVEIARRYAARLSDLLAPRRPGDIFWVHAELFPFLPSAVERLVFRPGAPVVYDWDDAVFVPYQEHRRALVRGVLGRKFEHVLGKAAAVTCGNAYLRDYCARFCERSMIVPTVVDTDVYRPAERGEGPLTLGWIGSPSTWVNVRPLLPTLARFCHEHGARFRAIGAGKVAAGDASEGLELADWAEATEVSEVQRFDIGIMPLIDGPFQRGKSGYKLIQYMACGLPTIASPIGVNRQIVTHGETGLIASSADQWTEALTGLAGDAALRRQMGQAGRARAVESYSLASQAPRLVDLFRSVAGSG
ncbi:glycosyltransferase family 4 protein [Sphingomonas lutea]|uniref:Glycosyltransferase family 4 protein n=1 Tax=Sphingomonas lutea TaxID=1045317 RepID=A0A7G9SEV5_9SPHN|nr:glycosyltransferase family 4 protein [Sphingomonas lutea]QNN66380.1 glycosyltransferase family 4 protein [Sphingomonas lutea]